MGNGIEIKIRGLDRSVVSRIDDLAKKKHMTRSEYLRGQLTSMAILPEIKEQEERYARLLNMTIKAIETNNAVLEQTVRVLENIRKGDKK